jgi:hypothetical protein
MFCIFVQLAGRLLKDATRQPKYRRTYEHSQRCIHNTYVNRKDYGNILRVLIIQYTCKASFFKNHGFCLNLQYCNYYNNISTALRSQYYRPRV